MSNTQNYYDAYKTFRTGLDSINSAYEDSLSSIEKYKGSEGFEEHKKQFQEKRKNEIENLRATVRPKMFKAIDDMQETAINRKMKIPTEDEIRLLEILKMRDSVSRDELLQAARTLADCSSALSVLDEIARKNNMPQFSRYYKPPTMATEQVQKIIESLKSITNKILEIDKKQSLSDYVAQYHAAIYGSSNSELVVPDLNALSKAAGDFEANSPSELLSNIIHDSYDVEIFVKAVDEGK